MKTKNFIKIYKALIETEGFLLSTLPCDLYEIDSFDKSGIKSDTLGKIKKSNIEIPQLFFRGKRIRRTEMPISKILDPNEIIFNE